MKSMYARLAWGVAALTLVLITAGVAFTLVNHASLPTDQVVANSGFFVPVMAFAVVGALIGARRPENSIGWICLAIGLLLALTVFADGVGTWGVETGSLSKGVVEWLGWLTSAWVPALGLMGTQLPLRLPDGRPLSRGWDRYARLCAVVVAVVTVVMFVQPGNVAGPAERDLSNPTGVAWADSLGALFLLIPLVTLGSIASVVVRYRRSASFERHQLRWIAFGAVVFFGTYVVAIGLLAGAGIDDSSSFGSVLTTSVQMTYAAIPVAIGIAVLRHRLYDIDVVINRALVYAALTATLGAAYLAAVLLLQLVLAPLTESSGLAVAASTLAVAGLFGPARSRIQGAVDRRFYRRKYDAVLTLESFSARLRDEIDLDSLSGELRDVIHRTMQPAHVTLWLRPATSAGEADAMAGTGPARSRPGA